MAFVRLRSMSSSEVLSYSVCIPLPRACWYLSFRCALARSHSSRDPMLGTRPDISVSFLSSYTGYDAAVLRLRVLGGDKEPDTFVWRRSRLFLKLNRLRIRNRVEELRLPSFVLFSMVAAGTSEVPRCSMIDGRCLLASLSAVTGLGNCTCKSLLTSTRSAGFDFDAASNTWSCSKSVCWSLEKGIQYSPPAVSFWQASFVDMLAMCLVKVSALTLSRLTVTYPSNLSIRDCWD